MKSRRLIAIIGSASFFLFSFAYGMYGERITQFESHIIVNRDATMHVQETITVESRGGLIRHGITRSFPTRYETASGLNVTTGFDVREVLLDGRPVHFQIIDHANGKQLYIGSLDTQLRPGKHIYTIIYNTNFQLGFFANHDELYWNVIGNDTRVPIDYVSVQVDLPAGVPTNQIQTSGYTGFKGEAYHNYHALVEKDGAVIFETTQALGPHQGFTIVVAWPKGFVTQPAGMTRLWHTVTDNWGLLVLLSSLLLLILFYIGSFIHLRRNIKQGTIIPLFYPPKKLLPGAVRYIMRKGYDEIVLAADVVNMAVMQALTIEYKKKSIFSSSYYTLKKENQSLIEQIPLYHALYSQFFMQSNECVLRASNAPVVEQAATYAKQYYYNQYATLFKSGTWYVLGGVAISLLALSVLFFAYVSPLWAVGCLVSFIIINGYSSSVLATYTQEEQKLKEDIEGFKLFLGTTETERLKIVGTPPAKTPHLYEQYLPYAIALGAEQQWTRQFASVFARLAQQKTPYNPVWYSSPIPFDVSQLGHVGSGLSHSIAASIISASSFAPGSSSGLSRGSSGGGGGGGGVGGW